MRFTFCVFVSDPLVAVIVMALMPPGVVMAVVTVMVVVPLPVTVSGEKVAVAPVGKPDAAKVTGPLKPPCPVMVMVEVVELLTFTLAGVVAARVKSVPTMRSTAGPVTSNGLLTPRAVNLRL